METPPLINQAQTAMQAPLVDEATEVPIATKAWPVAAAARGLWVASALMGIQHPWNGRLMQAPLPRDSVLTCWGASNMRRKDPEPKEPLTRFSNCPQLFKLAGRFSWNPQYKRGGKLMQT